MVLMRIRICASSRKRFFPCRKAACLSGSGTILPVSGSREAIVSGIYSFTAHTRPDCVSLQR